MLNEIPMAKINPPPEEWRLVTSEQKKISATLEVKQGCYFFAHFYSPVGYRQITATTIPDWRGA